MTYENMTTAQIREEIKTLEKMWKMSCDLYDSRKIMEHIEKKLHQLEWIYVQRINKRTV